MIEMLKDELMKKFDDIQARVNILDFIDSPDIREHNRNTHFTPAEQAVLVAMSDRRTLEEKKAALQQLADTYREEEFQAESVWPNRHPEQTPFRQVVLDTITRWNEQLEKRDDEENVVYAARVTEKEMIGKKEGEEKFFSSFDKAYQYLVTEKRRYQKEPDLKDIELCAQINRIHMDGGRQSDDSRYDFDHEMRMIRIVPGERAEGRINLETDFYVYVPLPFKRGELVKVESPFRRTFYGVMPSTWWDRELDFYLRKGGAKKDMMIYLMAYDPKTLVSLENPVQVLEMRYTNGDEIPEKEHQILKQISACRKGEMDWADMMRDERNWAQT